MANNSNPQPVIAPLTVEEEGKFLLLNGLQGECPSNLKADEKAVFRPDNICAYNER